MSELERKALANDRLVRNGALACVLALAATLLGIGMAFYAPGASASGRLAARASLAGVEAANEFRQEADRSSRGVRSDGSTRDEGADLSTNTYADVSARR